jgi:hypothetical protein
MGRYKLRSRTKMRAINKMVYSVAGASILGLAAYYSFFINTTQVTTSKAGIFRNMMLGYDINSGDVIAAFTWDDGKILTAEIGTNATAVAKDAVCAKGGAENTIGIGPGKSGNPLKLEIAPNKELNLGGIDVSLDYIKSESTCSFFSRGNTFNFGIKDGKLAVNYTLDNGTKRAEEVAAVTRYEVPDDTEFRNYRFIYNPKRGKAEIFVNNVVIWSNETTPDQPLVWDEDAPMVLGKDMKGNGSGMPVVDNAAIRATQQVNKLPVTLLNFEARAENSHVMITWFTANETDIDSFIVERSSDAISFNEVGRVKAAGNSTSLLAYALLDKQPSPGVTYYRLIPSNLPLRSMTISLIGYKYRGTNGDTKLSDLPPGEVKN